MVKIKSSENTMKWETPVIIEIRVGWKSTLTPARESNKSDSAA
jgi:hypothetical protein